MKKWFQGLDSKVQLFVILLIIVFVYLLVRKIKKMIAEGKMVKVNYNNVPVVGTQNGQPVIWNPDPLAREIYEKLEGYNMTTYPETVQKILDLQTDDQVKLLYNHYNKNYATDYPTLTQLISHEWSDWGGVYAKAVSRLKGLGLN